MPKGIVGFPLVIVVGAVAVYWLFLKDKNKKGWKLWELEKNVTQLKNQKRWNMTKKIESKLAKIGVPTAYVGITAIVVSLIDQHLSVCD